MGINQSISDIFEALKVECFVGKYGITDEEGEVITEITEMLNRGYSVLHISEQTGVSQVAILFVRDYIAELDKIELGMKRRIKRAREKMMQSFSEYKDKPMQTFEEAITEACKNGQYLINDTEYIFGNQEIKAPFFMSLLQRIKMGNRRRIVIDSEDCIKGTPKELDEIKAYMEKY